MGSAYPHVKLLFAIKCQIYPNHEISFLSDFHSLLTDRSNQFLIHQACYDSDLRIWRGPCYMLLQLFYGISEIVEIHFKRMFHTSYIVLYTNRSVIQSEL